MTAKTKSLSHMKRTHLGYVGHITGEYYYGPMRHEYDYRVTTETPIGEVLHIVGTAHMGMFALAQYQNSHQEN